MLCLLAERVQCSPIASGFTLAPRGSEEYIGGLGRLVFRVQGLWGLGLSV